MDEFLCVFLETLSSQASFYSYSLAEVLRACVGGGGAGPVRKLAKIFNAESALQPELRTT